ncbi:class I SAM-dependent methyltransferase [uncultured Draconibacterium sp.]|uniref:class I SAM-dependent methyltransferase n=1 Tax=uncultured Draconibacterium sp. TaxID=1573823 RepID=UPI0025D78E0B|nr:class I SAM-dependent methyltransferase [uncultured Draconibacterium sp.]
MHYCTLNLNCSAKDRTVYSKDKNLIFEQCNDCGIIWRAQDSIEITKPYEQDYFDSKKYENKRSHKVKKSGWLIDLARIHNPNINSLLEIGCSIGYTLEAAAQRNIKHLGIDISTFAVEYCKNKGLNASNQTFEELLDGNYKFDLIYQQHVLEHFQNPFKVLHDCHKLLNTNGLILIMVPNSKYRRAEKKRSKHRFYSKKGVGAEHFVYFDYTNLESVLEASGFKVVQKNYPVLTTSFFSLSFFINRIGRRLLSVFGSDQEILIIAQKQQ